MEERMDFRKMSVKVKEIKYKDWEAQFSYNIGKLNNRRQWEFGAVKIKL